MKRGSNAPHRLQKKGKFTKNDYKEAKLELGEHGKGGKTGSPKKAVAAALSESGLSPRQPDFTARRNAWMKKFF